MIVDCFTYAGEEDLLALRLETLDRAVGRFVIAEATRTFTGSEREPLFEISRFARWRDRIDYRLVTDLDAAPQSAWHNEYRQRNALGAGLEGARGDDRVLLSDVDEIPAPAALALFEPRRWLSAVLEQRPFYYFLNNELVEVDGAREVAWRMARITTVGRFRCWFGSMQNLRVFRGRGPWRSVARVWNRRRTQLIPHGGWHFSYLMTPEQIVQKLESFSHQEFNREEYKSIDQIRRRVRERSDLFGMDRRFEVVEVDAGFPLPLQQDRARFARWLA